MDFNKTIQNISVKQREKARTQWNAACSGIGLNNYEQFFETIWKAYSDTSRGYHGIPHLMQCLEVCERNRSAFILPDEMTTALFFHDYIYDTHQPDRDNVHYSISSCRYFLEHHGCHPERVEYICYAIESTAHEKQPFTSDAALVMDIDLSMLQYYNFEAIEYLVRKEYAWVSLSEYQRARKDILIKLYLREHLYNTEMFRERYETRTKAQLFKMITYNCSKILVAGTFDLFHKGHRLLIKKALSVAGEHSKVIVGLTSDEMASKKSHPVQPYDIRKRNISNFIVRSKPNLNFEIVPLNDPIGDAGTNPDYDILVASKETDRGARLVNEIRKMGGRNPLILILIEEIVGEDGKRISSTLLRNQSVIVPPG